MAKKEIADAFDIEEEQISERDDDTDEGGSTPDSE